MASQRIDAMDAHVIVVESTLRNQEVLLRNHYLTLKEHTVQLNDHSAKVSSVGDITKFLAAMHAEMREGFQ